MSDVGGVAGDQLRSFIERIEKLEEEKAEIADQIKAVKAEAKAAGFDVKIVNQMIKERRQDPATRAEFQELCDVYRAALGMLGGTPLGESARKRLTPDDDQPDRTDGSPGAAPPAEWEKEEISDADLDAARQRGRNDCKTGSRIVDNPYVADDPRRAAWDEGWCAQSGSDGMEIPEAWRRRKTQKPDLAPVDPTSWPPKPMPKDAGQGAEAG